MSESQPKRTSKYLPFEEAREFVRSEQIPSRSKYDEWWQTNKPKTIPRWPYRVYDKQWTTWNDFLGTNNEFTARKASNWLSHDEAVEFVHKLKLENQQQWMEYTKSGEKPANIPARPDLVYTKVWRGWSYWLGRDAAKQLEFQQRIQASPVYFIIHERDYPSNVYTFGIENRGLASIKRRYEATKCDIIKMYWYKPEEADFVDRVVQTLSTPFGDYSQTRLVQNIWEVMYYLHSRLTAVTKEEALAAAPPAPVQTTPQITPFKESETGDSSSIILF